MPLPVLAYDVLARLAGGPYRLAYSRRVRLGKEDPDRRRERDGFGGRPRPDGQLVWFHAASVGETTALAPVIAALLAEQPDLHVLVTSTTLTSAKILADVLPERAFHQFSPFDTPTATRRFVDHWKPDLAVWTESEIWPCLIRQTARRRVPMFLINARVSARTARTWQRWPRTVSALLSFFERILVQDARLAALMQDIGVRAEILEVTGSTKEDAAALPCDAEDLTSLEHALGSRRRWLAASTHRGEDECVIAAHKAAFGHEKTPPLLIIAPRHPERGAEVMALLEAAGLSASQRTRGDPIAGSDAYVADTIGEMGLWFRLCPLAFVGGSLVPVGGHNPIEPIALGCAVLHGPQVENFSEIYERLDAAGGACCVTDQTELAAALPGTLDPQTRQDLVERGARALGSGQSATRRITTLIRGRLAGSDTP